MSSAAILAHSDELAIGRPYPERIEREPGMHDRAAELLLAALLRPACGLLRDPARGLRGIVGEAGRHEYRFSQAADDELLSIARGMRYRLRRIGFTPPLVGECFALVREAAERTIGQRHYDVQLMGGWGLLQGKLIEMATGEGKTIAATLPAATVALAGYPVHVVTVNDYLAERDAEEMGPLYRFLGVDVGAVVQGMPRQARQEAYRKPITYCTNKELAFDYLRDRVALTQRSSRLHLSLEKLRGSAPRDRELVLRGLYFGIVDEADSVFIDEARTPLILASSAGGADERRQCEEALDLARRLVPHQDYTADFAERHISLSDKGRDSLAALAAAMDGVWTSVRAREELVEQALSALILFHRDRQYVVSGEKVEIVDESTGRVMPDRSWERGLHQLIEAKEGCALTPRRETLARLTYQRLFRRFIRLSGMTGTGREVAREIGSVYGLPVVRVPPHRPSRRRYCRPQICATAEEKWRRVAETVEAIAIGDGRPALIGTRSVKSSEEISAVLNARGIDHALLNAKQDREEAGIIAQAGQPARVTVATNMAGRGTDIRLGDDVAARGGLHVILTEHHDSRRVDRQFFGRCARQGDPGSCQAIVSLEDEIYTVYAPLAARLARRLAGTGSWPTAVFHHALLALAQYRAERQAGYLRAQNLKLDRRLDRVLAFSGTGE